MQFSINNYYGEQVSKCGYCKQTNCSVAYGMHAYTMIPQDYQDLIDRGWRRSGLYLYKPNNKNTCCPLYTIKCDALEFKLSKSHKKVLKRMNRFLRDGKRDKSEVPTEWTLDEGHDESNFIGEEPKEPQVSIPEVNLAEFAAANPDNRKICEKSESSKSSSQSPKYDNEALLQPDSIDQKNAGSIPSDTMNPPCKKAKQMRLERKQAKLAAKGAEISQLQKPKNIQNQEKSLSDFLNETGPNDKHKLKIVLVAAHKLVITDEALSLYRNFLIVDLNNFQLELVHVNSKQFSDTLSTTYSLYEKYQTRVHNDPPDTVVDYLEFLQRSPLQHCKPADGPVDGYGSFHQQYWLDDKLIAVAVIDILPYCVSSVYFFYDPDYSFLSLGTYGSLREIEFVQQLAKEVPALKYYYMGFYIHSCPKMRYKGKLIPSYLLCPETYTWSLLTDAIRSQLDEHKYQRFNPDSTAKDEDGFSAADLARVLLLVENNKFVPYGRYIELTGDDDDRDRVIEYGELVGRQLAHRMLYLKL